MPCIRDRVVQGALQLILEAIVAADFCPNSYGFRPTRSPHQALADVRRRVRRRMSTVRDVDLARYFDTIQHAVLLDKIAPRVQDPAGMRLIKQIMHVSGPVGVPPGGPFSPLAANSYLHEVDWTLDAMRRKTAEGPYEAINAHRFADDMVITVSGHPRKRGWAQRAFQRLEAQLLPLGVPLHPAKTQLVNTLRGEAFGCLGFDLRRVQKRTGEGSSLFMTPKKQARKAITATIRAMIRGGGATPITNSIARMNAALAGWVTYFRGGNARRAVSAIRA